MRLGVIADSHVAVGNRALESAGWHNPYRLRDSLQRLVRAVEHPLLRDADALVVLGDLVHFGDAPSLDATLDALSHFHGPVVAISGNHDVIDPDVRLEREIGATGVDVWSPCCRDEPTRVTELFRTAGIGLQVIEVIAQWPTPERPFAVTARTVVAGDPGGPGVTLTHFPLLGFQHRADAAGFLYSGHLDQLADRPDLDRGWRAHLVLSGHLHLRAVERQRDTVQISFGALIEAPYEIGRIDFDGLDVAYRCESLEEVTEERVPLLDPAQGAHTL